MVNKEIKQPKKQSYRLQQNWKPCTFELDGAGNIIFRLPRDAKEGERLRVVTTYNKRTSTMDFRFVDGTQKVFIVVRAMYAFDQRGLDYNLYGAYCLIDEREEDTIIKHLYNIK